MLSFNVLYVPAAALGTAYSATLVASGGTAPYTFAIQSGTLPNGISFDNGVFSGTPTSPGSASLVIGVTDSALPVPATIAQTYVLSVVDQISLSDLTVENTDFVTQFQNALAKDPAWATNLTTTTGQTLIELVSTVGAFNEARIIRANEDAFPESAQSDSALRATAVMQGMRLTRKLPATINATITSTDTNITYLPPFTQFSAAGQSWFNQQGITVPPTGSINVTLAQGSVVQAQVTGLGTNLQAWISNEDNFVVSDQDVQVAINGATITKSFGGLWNYLGTNAWEDRTLSSGRLCVQFGSTQYGAVPKVTDVVTITYVITSGSNANSVTSANTKISTVNYPLIGGLVLTNPSGGSAEKDPIAYKNYSAGAFGSYGSAVTKGQYQAVVNSYPGIIDSITQAQREINPSALQWMNTMRISALTNSPWSQTQKDNYIKYLSSSTMYSTQFIWVDPVPLPRVLDVSIYVFNSVMSLANAQETASQAITNLFGPRAGILLTDLYPSDIDACIRKALPNQVSYVVVNEPTGAMIVSSPASPKMNFTVTPSGGTLTPAVHSYSVSADTPAATGQGGTDIGAPSNWVFPQVTVTGSSISLDWSNSQTPGATAYHVWGRLAGHLAKLADLAPNVTSFVDDGSITPSGTLPSTLSDMGIRYNTIESLKVTAFYDNRVATTSNPGRSIV